LGDGVGFLDLFFYALTLFHSSTLNNTPHLLIKQPFSVPPFFRQLPLDFHTGFTH
jgi:hypothetical protein